MSKRLMWFVLLSALAAAILLSLSLTSPAEAATSHDTSIISKNTHTYLPFSARSLTAEPGAVPTATPTGAPGSWNWLNHLNRFRAMAKLPPVAEELSWSTGAALHSRYMVKTNTVNHGESASSPWYTPEGQAAAQSSNLIGSERVDATDRWALDSWMMAPFHAVGILDPHLARVGFGSYREADGGVQMGGALDVLRGWGELPAGIQFPILWPGPGAVVDLGMFWGETPNPLTSCPGYTSPAGLPLMIQIGPGTAVPDVTAHSFFRGSTPLEHCVFDETDYRNPDGSQQGTGRAILGLRDAIILLPRQPLAANTTYTASVTVNGQTYKWSFTVGNIP